MGRWLNLGVLLPNLTISLLRGVLASKEGATSYIQREIEGTIDAMLSQGKVVLVTDERQVGKTTTLKERLGDRFGYVSMETPRDYVLAKQDATLLFESKSLPLIIDEVQRVPELFSPMKWIVDQSEEKGRIVLTGPQAYHPMNAGANPLDVWFYHDSKKREIDLAIREGHVLHPTETKTSAMVGTDAVSNLNRLEAIEVPEVGFGHVICQTQEPHYAPRGVKAIPVWAI